MWIYVVLVLLVLCCIWHMMQIKKLQEQVDGLEAGSGGDAGTADEIDKIKTWISGHQEWSQERFERANKLETAVCALENWSYDPPKILPDPNDKFCTPGNGPGDGHGSSAPPKNGF